MDAIFAKLLNLSIVSSFLIIAEVILRLILSKAPKWIRYILWAKVALRLMIPFSFESSLSLIPNAQKIDSSSTTSTTYISTVPTDTVQATTQPPDVLKILGYVWIVGVVIMLLYMLVSFLKVHKMVNERVLLRDNIYVCDHLKSPFVLGVFRPKIYLDSSMGENEAEYIIAHEQAHIKHLDNVWKPLGFILLSVYWFNPLCYLAYFLFVKDIELFCDESVIKTYDANSKKEYSTVLLECGITSKAISRCPLAFSENNVKQRIKSILKYKKPTLYIIVGSVILCAVVVVLFMTNPVSAAEIFSPVEVKPETVVATQAPTQPPTEAPTQPPTEEPTEKPTEAPTEAEYVEEYYDYPYDDSYYDYYEGRPLPSIVPFEPVDVYPPWAQESSNTNTEKEPSLYVPSNITPYEGEIVWDPNGPQSSGPQRADGWITGIE